MARGHQSVYDKAMTIFQERTKKLKVAEQEIEKERIQSNIDFRFEERKVKEDLIKMSKERKRIVREAKTQQLPSLNREKTYQSWMIREKQKVLRSLSTERNPESFPAITCTVANIPKIMKRSISKESQFHNWLIGLPKIQDSSGKRTVRSVRLAKGDSEDDRGDARAIKRHSKVANIVYNVPLTLRDTKTAAERHYEVSSHRERKHAVFVATSENWKSKRLPKLKRAIRK